MSLLTMIMDAGDEDDLYRYVESIPPGHDDYLVLFANEPSSDIRCLVAEKTEDPQILIRYLEDESQVVADTARERLSEFYSND